jgi:hypothetical protein
MQSCGVCVCVTWVLTAIAISGHLWVNYLYGISAIPPDLPMSGTKNYRSRVPALKIKCTMGLRVSAKKMSFPLCNISGNRQ